MHSAYLQEFSEFKVTELLFAVVPEVQTDELAVPVEGNVVVHCGLAEDVSHILCSTNTHVKYLTSKAKQKVGRGRKRVCVSAFMQVHLCVVTKPSQ